MNSTNYRTNLINYSISSIIEKKLILDIKNILDSDINGYIETYDILIDNMVYPINDKIKNKIKKQFQEKLSLPAILSVDIVECNNKCCNQV